MFARISNNPSSLSQDPYLAPFREIIARRAAFARERRGQVLGPDGADLAEAADWHRRFGLHLETGATAGWLFREWLPNATCVWLCGDFNNWRKCDEYALRPSSDGCWERRFPKDAISHLQQYRLFVEWQGGSGWRLPTAATRVVRTRGISGELVFNACVWEPDSPFAWKHDNAPRTDTPLIYEAHIGMAQEAPKIGTFNEFADKNLSRIAKGGYTCVQLMAVAQHPYYASFGYHVSNFFSVCDLFGSPDEFKRLVDAAHAAGLRVIMDMVLSHSVKNQEEGLACIAGDFHQFFKDEHPAWGSLCFDYAKPEVLRFLISVCRFWLEEYHLDGFRFDGVTSMLYHDHGLGHPFTSYDDYFGTNANWDAIAFLALANETCHAVNPNCWTIAEDVSGMPGLAAPINDGGLGFDYRLAMGVTDTWFKLLDIPDDNWSMGLLWHEMTNGRRDEKTISYVECHDQALVGGKTFIFTCLDAEMYGGMNLAGSSLAIDRGIALHKMARLLTAATADHGYMNFMGNEFGHPEWIDFPREGNGNSFNYARRQWSLADNPLLKYHRLLAFDNALTRLLHSTVRSTAQPAFYECRRQLILLSEREHVIAFERGGFFFVFNFHPVQSYQDFAIQMPAPGIYRIALSTDDAAFCGFNRIRTDINYPATTTVMNNMASATLRLYLPARTAIVLKKCLE